MTLKTVLVYPQCHTHSTVDPDGTIALSKHVLNETGASMVIITRILLDLNTVKYASTPHVTCPLWLTLTVQMDAPVSGGVVAAETGQLAFMAGVCSNYSSTCNSN